jgi:hypothetical protein
MPLAAKLTLLAAVAVLITIAPCFAAPAAAVPATPATSWLTAAVVDFVDSVSYPNHRAGWRAAEWTQAALVKAARWTMISRDKVRLAASGLPVPGPLPSTADLQRLADSAGANLIVSGTLRAVTLDSSAASVTADLRLEVIDAATGETVLTGAGKGVAKADRANPEPTDVLVEDALHKASDAAVTALLLPKSGTGSVLARTGSQELVLGFPSGSPKVGARVLIVRAEGGERAIIAVAEVRKSTSEGLSALIVAQTEAPRLDDPALLP